MNHFHRRGSYIMASAVPAAFTDCPHCHSLCVDNAILPCGHVVCRTCLLGILEQQESACPDCGGIIPRRQGQTIGQTIDELGRDCVLEQLVNEQLVQQGDTQSVSSAASGRAGRSQTVPNTSSGQSAHTERLVSSRVSELDKALRTVEGLRQTLQRVTTDLEEKQRLVTRYLTPGALQGEESSLTARLYRMLDLCRPPSLDRLRQEVNALLRTQEVLPVGDIAGRYHFTSPTRAMRSSAEARGRKGKKDRKKLEQRVQQMQEEQRAAEERVATLRGKLRQEKTKGDKRVADITRRYKEEKKRVEEQVMTFVIQVEEVHRQLLEHRHLDEQRLSDVIQRLFSQFNIRLLGTDCGLRFLLDAPVSQWVKVVEKQLEIQAVLSDLIPEDARQDVTWTEVRQYGPSAEDIDLRIGQPLPVPDTSAGQRAFDTVWHAKLLDKLNRIGISGRLYQFVQAFLADRRISVRVGASLSDEHTLDMGVPQGSVIAPTLFSVMLHDIEAKSDLATEMPSAEHTVGNKGVEPRPP
ncbi:hypothetical protein BaRGS_00036768, partial [Batillaria attramentaria]